MKIKLNSKFDYKVVWRTHNICNFSCPYCFQKNSNDLKKIDNYYSIINKIINKINNELKTLNNKKIEIAFMGGEPTLINLYDIIKKIDPKNNFISFKIFTNFSASLEKYKKIFSLEKNNKKIGLSISIHDDIINFDNYINKALKLKKNIFNMSIVVLTEKNYINFLKYRAIFKNIKIIPQLCREYSNYNSFAKIITPQEIIKKMPEHFKKEYVLNNIIITKDEIFADKILNNKKKICTPKTEIYSDGTISDCSKNLRDKIFVTDIICNKDICSIDCIYVTI